MPGQKLRPDPKGRRKPLARKTRIAPRSKRAEAAGRAYTEAARRFICFKRIEQARCPVFPQKKVTEVHHKSGRLGALLLDQTHWVAVSSEGHRWIHAHPELARKAGLLAPLGEWRRL